MQKLKRPLIYSIVFLFSAFLGYRIFLEAYPYYRIRNALEKITRGSFSRNTWFYVPKLDVTHRDIRRVSSDVLYAYCLFDLSEGDTQVSLSPWNKYQAASVFSLNSDHHQTFRSETGGPVRFVLRKKDFPFQKGFIMMRRLASDDKDHRLADKCERK